MKVSQQGSKTPEMRLFYDPSGKYADTPDEIFYGEVAGQRPEVHATGFGPLRGSEVTLADSIHIQQDTPDAVLADIRPSRIASIHDFIHDRADRTASYIGSLALEKAKELPYLSGYPDISPEGEVDIPLLSARILGAIACHGITRRDGKPYITHPESVASIAEAGWRRLHNNTDYTAQLRLLKAIGYLHDAWEDTVDPKGDYLSRPIIASPLTVEYLMALGDFPHAHDVAQSMYLMSHTDGLLSDRLPYPGYMKRLIQLGRPEAKLGKAADNQHNAKIDADQHPLILTPKQKKRAKKYSDAELQLLQDETMPVQDIMVMHAILHVTYDAMIPYYTRLQRCAINTSQIDLNPTL